MTGNNFPLLLNTKNSKKSTMLPAYRQARQDGGKCKQTMSSVRFSVLVKPEYKARFIFGAGLETGIIMQHRKAYTLI